MITSIIYLIAYFAGLKFIPGIKNEPGQIDAKLFNASVGSFVGIIEGIFALFKSRHWIAFVLTPLVCAAVTCGGLVHRRHPGMEPERQGCSQPMGIHRPWISARARAG